MLKTDEKYISLLRKFCSDVDNILDRSYLAGRSEWLHGGFLSTYLRINQILIKGQRQWAFVVSNVSSNKKRRGIYTEFLCYVCAFLDPRIKYVVIENPDAEHLDFYKRFGFENVTPLGYAPNSRLALEIEKAFSKDALNEILRYSLNPVYHFQQEYLQVEMFRSKQREHYT